MALAGIGLFFVAFFPQALFGGKYLLTNDAFFYSYPLRTVAWNMIREGQLPLWTPYLLSGYPLLSMAQIGLAYPLTWFYLFLPGHVAEQIYVLAPFLLSPIMMFLYLREIGRATLAALFGALVFGYGGMMASPLANNGLMPNAVMWLPLLLIAIERAKSGSVLRPLLLGTFAYSMSVLTGYGQGFVYVGILAAAYALLLVATSGEGGFKSRIAHLRNWWPAIVAAAAASLAVGIAAFQILETARAVRRSVRDTLSYEAFTQGSFTLAQLWQSIFAPLLFGVDMYAYVPPLAIALAALTVIWHSLGKTGRDPRVFFWFLVAAASFVLMLGQHTPLYRLLYNVPLLNSFRVPSRHAFEWTFAVAVLAAYGWDLMAARLCAWRKAGKRYPGLPIYAALFPLAIAVVLGALWWLQATALRGMVIIPPEASRSYWVWKIAFVITTTIGLCCAFLVANVRLRFSLLLGCLLVVCYFEPAIFVGRWWGSINLTAERFTAISDATRYLKGVPPHENRVYTRVDLFSEQFALTPRLDPPNLSAVHGLHNIAGYEPLILERYSRALGGVGFDSVHTIANYAPDHTLLSDRSHVIDILNAKYIVAYSNLATALEPVDIRNVPASIQSLGELPPKMTRTFGAPPVIADTVLLVTSLANSVSVPQGDTVATLKLHLTDGGTIEHELRAGVDTAEWAHDRRDVRGVIRHQLATVFDSTPMGETDGFLAYRFQTQLPLSKTSRVDQISIENVSTTATLALFGVALLDSETGRAGPVVDAFPEKWQPVFEQRETLVLRNTRALPRAWLVAEAEAVDSEEALRRIRGESTPDFDPRRTALLEVAPYELPSLSGGMVEEHSVRITSYEPNRIVIETHAKTPTILVLSEIFYPGWEATVNDQPAKILLTNYLLRGVALPEGGHTVEMRYTAPGARNGIIISVMTLFLIAGLTVLQLRCRAGD